MNGFPRTPNFLRLAAMVWLSACSTLQVRSGHDASFDFSRLQSWDWAPGGGRLQTAASARTSERIRLDGLVREHVIRHLTRKGFVQQPGGGNFLLAWSFGEWQLERRSRPGGGYGAVGLMYPGDHASLIPVPADGRALPPSLDPHSAAYERARLELVVVDPKTKRVVWNASVTDDGDFGYFTSAQRDRIGDAVDKILDGFPPAP